MKYVFFKFAKKLFSTVCTEGKFMSYKSGPCNLHHSCGGHIDATDTHAITSDKSSIFDAGSLTLGDRKSRETQEGRGRPYVTTRGSCRYVILFLCLKEPSSSVGALWGTNGGHAPVADVPWRMPLCFCILRTYTWNSHVQGA